MMAYNKQILSNQVRKLGFIRDTLEKVCRLAEIMNFMAADPLLSETLALKGGTAVNLTIFNLPRLSIDIDLDYTRNNSREEMLHEREEITEIFKHYMYADGYELSSKSKTYHSLDSFVFAFINSAGIRDNIKVEINYSLRAHVLPLIVRPIETIGIFSKTNILSLSPIEIFASKIVALLTRTAARDLYDINNMVLFGLFDDSETDMLRKCVVFYSAIGSETISESFNIDKIDVLTNNKIRTDLQPVLRKKERFDLLDAQLRVKKYLSELLVLTDQEWQFLTAFRDGDYKPELLFTGKQLEQVRNHPMVEWKLRRG